MSSNTASQSSRKLPKVALVVQGDFRRAPRLQYLAHALLRPDGDANQQLAGQVHVFCGGNSGYDRSSALRVDSPPPNWHCAHLARDPNFDLSEFPSCPKVLEYDFWSGLLSNCRHLLLLINLIRIVLKLIFTFFAIFWTFCRRMRDADIVLMVNPPLYPGLIWLWLYSKLSGAKLIIDWHNSSASMQKLQFSILSGLVGKIFTKLENIGGSAADCVLAVSRTMEKQLKVNVNSNTLLIYDKPYSIFKFNDDQEKVLFYKNMSNNYDLIEMDQFYDQKTNSIRPGRPFLLITSSSWSLDDDFGMLLKSLQLLNPRVAVERPIICIMTGKGPGKQLFIEKIEKSDNLSNIQFKFPYLIAEDYVKILSASDLGVSLHFSSSGIDLPIKVVDMFGAGLPVLAYNYKAIDELVREDFNGEIFSNSEELANLILTHYADGTDLAEMRSNIEKDVISWDQYWNEEICANFKAKIIN